MASPDEPLPLLTFALFAYNHEPYIAESVAAALSQTYEPLDIILSDDCSNDRTFDIIERMASEYSGPHRVRIRRHTTNMGVARHVNEVLRLAEGKFFVLAAGDDVSNIERTATMVAAWTAQGEQADLICSEYDTITPEGNRQAGPRARFEQWNSPQSVARYGYCPLGATCAWSRRLWEKYEGIPENVRNEDQLMAFRAHLGGGILLCPERLMAYRLGSSNWNVRKDADVDDYSKHHRKIAPFQLSVAEATAADALRSGRSDLIALTERRRMECQIVDNIYNGQFVDYALLSKGLFSGCNLSNIAKPFLERKLPALFRMIRQRRRQREMSLNH